jgi:hypothetical protein
MGNAEARLHAVHFELCEKGSVLMATANAPQQNRSGGQRNGNGGTSQPVSVRPRVLRIGVLLGGKIVEERIIRERTAVTLGQSIKNTFSLPLEGLPLEFTMFAIHENRYSLNFLPNMDGRLSDGNNVQTLDVLRNSAAKDGGHFTIPLTDSARGKISLGDMTLLFQFVTEPPKQPKPMLPASVRGTLADRIEPRLAVFVAASLFVHGAAALWASTRDIELEDSITDKAYTLTFQPETFNVDVAPPPEPTAKTDGDAKPEPVKGADKPKTPDKKPAGDKKPADKPDKPEGGGRTTDNAVAIQQEAMAFANALTGEGEGKDDIGDMSKRRPGSELGQELTNVKESGKTVSTGGGSGRGSRGNGDPRTGTGKGTGVGGPTGTTTVGDGKAVEKTPGGRINVSDKQSFDESTLTPDAVLGKIQQAYMAGLKRCYKNYLTKDASARGKVTLSFTVNETGRSTGGKAKGFASEVDECISGQMSSWRFPIPLDKGEPTTAAFSIALQLVPE